MSVARPVGCARSSIHAVDRCHVLMVIVRMYANHSGDAWNQRQKERRAPTTKLCEAGTRCRPVNDECELVDCNPNTGSCAQSCETLELACQPILEAASCDELVCRRGEICKEELNVECALDQPCDETRTRAYCAIEEVPNEQSCLSGRITCGYGEVCAPDGYRVMHPGNQPPYFQAPWVCQPSRLNACNTVSCPETYTCMEALGRMVKSPVRARHVTLWKAANDQSVWRIPLPPLVIPTMPMPVVQKSSVSWICLRRVATSIIRSMVRLLGSVSRSLHASPRPLPVAPKDRGARAERRVR